METLIIKPKDKAELRFFVELAVRLGVNITKTENYDDELLFQAMENNKETPRIDRTSVIDTIQKNCNYSGLNN